MRDEAGIEYRGSVLTRPLDRSHILGGSDPPAREADPLLERLRAANAGDTGAMRDLVRAVAPHVRGAVASLSSGHADDVAQECLIAFVRALPAFRGDSSVIHYARRIAVRTAVHLRRARRLRQDVDQAHLDEGDAHADAVTLPSHEVAARRRRALLASLLDELPEVQAEALALRVVLGYSLEEIADATSAPVNTVRTRMRLAREALRLRIETDPTLAELAEDAS